MTPEQESARSGCQAARFSGQWSMAREDDLTPRRALAANQRARRCKGFLLTAWRRESHVHWPR